MSKIAHDSTFAAVSRRGWAAVAVLVVAAVAAVAAVALRGGASVAATLRAAGCTYRAVVPYPPKVDSNYHLDFPTLTTKPHWTTFPPAGGGHYRLWATWGFYRTPVNPRMAVHNEEHGGIVIWWGPGVPQATIDQLESFYGQSPVGMLGTPIAGLGKKIALTAWDADPAWKGDPALAYAHHDYGIGRIAVCPRFDQKAFAAFRDAYRGHSPQGFPLSGDAPGCGPEKPCS
jgi:Protein of unknown function (DUF3105)